VLLLGLVAAVDLGQAAGALGLEGADLNGEALVVAAQLLGGEVGEEYLGRSHRTHVRIVMVDVPGTKLPADLYRPAAATKKRASLNRRD
jgi:hypothetical protein